MSTQANHHDSAYTVFAEVPRRGGAYTVFTEVARWDGALHRVMCLPKLAIVMDFHFVCTNSNDDSNDIMSTDYWSSLS